MGTVAPQSGALLSPHRSTSMDGCPKLNRCVPNGVQRVPRPPRAADRTDNAGRFGRPAISGATCSGHGETTALGLLGGSSGEHLDSPCLTAGGGGPADTPGGSVPGPDRHPVRAAAAQGYELSDEVCWSTLLLGHGEALPPTSPELPPAKAGFASISWLSAGRHVSDDPFHR